jgi:hypothetical protein
MYIYIREPKSRGFDGLSSVGQTPGLTIQLQFTLYKKQRIAGGRELGSYKFQLLDDKSNVVAEHDWTRIPPDKPTSSAPDWYNSYSEIEFFDSSASRLLLKVWVFPVNAPNAGKAEMDNASFAKEVSVNLPRGAKGHIKIGVNLAAKTQTFHVPKGQTLQNVLVQNKISPFHVVKVSPPKPEADYYDVTHVFLEDIGQAEAKTMITGSCKLRRGRIYCR